MRPRAMASSCATRKCVSAAPKSLAGGGPPPADRGNACIQLPSRALAGERFAVVTITITCVAPRRSAPASTKARMNFGWYTPPVLRPSRQLHGTPWKVTCLDMARGRSPTSETSSPKATSPVTEKDGAPDAARAMVTFVGCSTQAGTAPSGPNTSGTPSSSVRRRREKVLMTSAFSRPSRASARSSAKRSRRGPSCSSA